MSRPIVPRGAGPRLVRALRALLAGAPGEAEVRLLSSVAWTSTIFAGERHHLEVILAGDGAAGAAEALLAALADAELGIPGHLLADIHPAGEVRDGAAVRLRLAAVTVESGEAY
jgi:hypothetical protein